MPPARSARAAAQLQHIHRHGVGIEMTQQRPRIVRKIGRRMPRAALRPRVPHKFVQDIAGRHYGLRLAVEDQGIRAARALVGRTPGTASTVRS